SLYLPGLSWVVTIMPLYSFRCPFGLSQSEMAAKMTSSETTTPWSCHPVYARYWQHYYQAMAWMRSHQNAYLKAVKSYFSSPWYFTLGDLPRSSYAKKGDLLSPSVPITWPPRAPTVVIHLLQGLGTVLTTAQAKTNLGPQRRRQ
ncbi:Gem-associated protein 8, partial [Myotis davidii]